MKTQTLVLIYLLAIVGGGCSGSTTTMISGATGAGGGSSSTSATASSATSSHASTSGAGGQGTGGQGTGGQGCTGFIDVTQDKGAPMHWTSICFDGWGWPSSMTAVGWLLAGGAGPGAHSIDVEGCQNSGDLVASPGIHLSATNAMSPGTYTAGSITYTDSMSTPWGVPGDGFMMTVTKIDPVGGHIDGTFSGSVSHGGNAAHALAGSFHVCRVADELVP
jgi:hypothetical protein